MEGDFRRAVLAIAFVAILPTIGCSAPKKLESPPPANIDQLKSSIQAVLDRRHIPGVGIALVSKDGVIWAGGVGKADLASGRDVTADTMFRVGSITKGFVALSILKLAEQGKVSLDTKVSDIAPEIPIVNPWNDTDPVRVVNLLEHTAGFDDFSLAEFYDLGEGPNKPLRDTLIEFPGPEHVRWRPSTRWSYSNPGYGLAGYVLEKISGKSCEDYVADNILRPIGMTHSDMRLTPEVKAALAQGYEHVPPRPVAYRRILLRPAGEMKSSPNEMARFVRMMLNRGQLDGVRIVSEESIKRMETAVTSVGAKAGLPGYGLGNLVDPSHKFVMHGHDGGIDGFVSRYAYIPERGFGYFFSANIGNAGPVSGFKEIDDLIFGYLTRDAAELVDPPRSAMTPDIGEWTGFYEPAAPRNSRFQFTDLLQGGVWIYLRDGKLYRRPIIARRQELIPVGGHLFRTGKDPVPTAAFAVGDLAQRVMVSYFTPTLPIPIYFEKTSAVWPVARFVLILGAIPVMLSSIVFVFVWLPRKVFGRMKGVRHLSVRVLPLLAVLAIVGSLVPASTSSPIEMASPTAKPIAVMILSILFALFSVAGLVLAIRSFRWEMNRAARIHSLLVSIACFGWTWYLAYWGMIGVRLWQPR